MNSTTIIILLLLFFLGIAAVLFFIFRKRKKNDPHPTVPSLPEQENQKHLSDFRTVFLDKIGCFQKDMLAYHLERLVWKNHLPTKTIEEIREKYGKVLLQPSFLIYSELNRHNLSADDLRLIEKEWFQKHDRPLPADKPEEEIEKIVFEEEHKKAIEILAQFMPDGEKCIDYLN